MRGRALGAGLGAIVAIALGVWWFGLAREVAVPGRRAPRAPNVDGSSAAAADAGRGRPGAPAAADGGPPGGARGPQAARWRALLETIRTAQARRVAAAPRGTPNDEAVGTLDPDTIRNGVRDMKDLLAECYESALRDEPALQGRLVVEFTLVGEPGVGAVVEDSSIDPESELGANASLSECVRETLMTLELPAPPQGGKVRVRYPFVFRTAEPDGGG